MDLERRAFAECRVDAVDSRRLRGYAIVTDVRSQNLGGFVEVIAPAALARTFREAIDVRALVDHDAGKVLGRLTAGTLAIAQDARGLQVVIEPDPEISYARDLLRSVSRGDVSGMSFGFRVLEDDWALDRELPTRTVLDMRVSEISVVSFPAYLQTDVTVAQRMREAGQARGRTASTPQLSVALRTKQLQILRAR